jgi:hypothetical protein
VEVALDVAVGGGVGVAVSVGVRVTVADGVVVEDAVAAEVIDGDGDALTVCDARATSVASCRAAYTMYASAARSGMSRRKSRSFLTTPCIVRGNGVTRNQAAPRQPQDYSDFTDLCSPSFFLPYPPPAGTLILG